ncbi:hypothetical protein [Oceanobacillus alkalisoli]|uniref:hypothetical protein n=1 Tax=Oceanobacillus alkalisoli TaxID=2925113 RepID=UPI001F12128C|nr:hypothetical protein [Oceanobacillus alkalisoli]MCF3943809.1 hypothetical protein [Oceanobacillus alkalisoli]
MDNLSEHKASDIEKLSPEAQQFYKLYKNEINNVEGDGEVTKEEVLSFLNTAHSSDEFSETNDSMVSAAWYSPVGQKILLNEL